MELLIILLIFSLGVVMVGCCFIGGIAFCLKVLKNIVSNIFGSDKK